MAKARKRFGQHFLEPAWVRKLVDAIDAQASDRFVEIGPGRGAITQPLAERVDKLVAIEVDRDLAAALAARALPRVEVVNADVLTVDLEAVGRQLQAAPTSPDVRLRIVGNLPYNITTPILFRLLAASASRLFSDATLMLQKEVADRLVAKPGTRDYGVLTISTLVGADVTRLLSLPPGAFRPAPKVHSAVVRLVFHPPPDFVRDPALTVAIVRSVFTQRRKTLANALAASASARGRTARDVLSAAEIDPRRRPEALDLGEFARLADELSKGERGP